MDSEFIPGNVSISLLAQKTDYLLDWFCLTDLTNALSKDRDLCDKFHISTQTSFRNKISLYLLFILIQK